MECKEFLNILSKKEFLPEVNFYQDFWNQKNKCIAASYWNQIRANKDKQQAGKPQPKKKENKLDKGPVKNPKEIEEEKVDTNGNGPQGTATNNGNSWIF